MCLTNTRLDNRGQPIEAQHAAFPSHYMICSIYEQGVDIVKAAVRGVSGLFDCLFAIASDALVHLNAIEAAFTNEKSAQGVMQNRMAIFGTPKTDALLGVAIDHIKTFLMAGFHILRLHHNRTHSGGHQRHHLSLQRRPLPLCLNRILHLDQPGKPAIDSCGYGSLFMYG